MESEQVKGPIWAREAARRRSTLTREAIVRAAMGIADAEGLAAVSIRRVATELGARTMSLYSHIERKEDLLDLMADEVSGELLIRDALPDDWREAITMITRREREAAGRHPWIADLVSRHPAVGPNGLRHLEQSLAALSGLPATPQDRHRVLAAVEDYVTGFIIRQTIEKDRPRETFTQPYLRELVDGGEFPHLAPLIAGDGPDVEDNFERGLRWLLDGVAAGLLTG
ncbi:TetR/AcrR family transcriptional regulator C-terminal domain-containing protein [Streptosporangium sp. NPDC023615]|uniref:TetR/AcrR family transcriptional regulator C-terminal domain-containing protein n=1 Tax=Streptosporangium sp. NPDC023615 TaxID=3154794 RepID=UPI0034362D00